MCGSTEKRVFDFEEERMVGATTGVAAVCEGLLHQLVQHTQASVHLVRHELARLCGVRVEGTHEGTQLCKHDTRRVCESH